MRYLIASNDIAQSSLTSQREFFGTHMQPWLVRLCDAIDTHPSTRFYRAVTGLARAFFEVEMQAFDMI
jgi:TorA maturation chaperone TorD